MKKSLLMLAILLLSYTQTSFADDNGIDSATVQPAQTSQLQSNQQRVVYAFSYLFNGSNGTIHLPAAQNNPQNLPTYPIHCNPNLYTVKMNASISSINEDNNSPKVKTNFFQNICYIKNANITELGYKYDYDTGSLEITPNIDANMAVASVKFEYCKLRIFGGCVLHDYTSPVQCDPTKKAAIRVNFVVMCVPKQSA